MHTIDLLLLLRAIPIITASDIFTQNKHFKTQKERESTSKKSSGMISKWQAMNMTVWQEATADLTSRKPFQSRGDTLHVRERTMAGNAAHPHRTLRHLLLQEISDDIVTKMTRSKVFLH